MRSGWKNAKHASQWSATLKTYAYPVLGPLTVEAVDTALALLRKLAKVKRGPFVIPGQADDRPMSNMSMAMALRRISNHMPAPIEGVGANAEQRSRRPLAEAQFGTEAVVHTCPASRQAIPSRPASAAVS